MNIQSTNFQQKCQEYTMGREYSLQQIFLGKLDTPNTKELNWTLILYHASKNKLKKDQILKHRLETIKPLL